MHYFDDETGAHFEYNDLCNRIALLLYNNNLNDPSITTTSVGKSINETIKANQLPLFVAHQNCKNRVSLIPPSAAPKNKDIFLSNKKILATTALKKPTQNTIRSITSKNAAKKLDFNLKTCKHNTIDNNLCKPRSKNANTKCMMFSGFNFKSLDNRKKLDTMAVCGKAPLNDIFKYLDPQKKLPANHPIPIRSSNVI